MLIIEPLILSLLLGALALILAHMPTLLQYLHFSSFSFAPGERGRWTLTMTLQALKELIIQSILVKTRLINRAWPLTRAVQREREISHESAITENWQSVTPSEKLGKHVCDAGPALNQREVVYYGKAACILYNMKFTFILALKVLKYLCINHGEQTVLSIWNHHKCLS